MTTAHTPTSFIFKAIFIHHVGKGYTAYIKGLDGVISQGENKEEAKKNLFKSLEVMAEINSEEPIKTVDDARIEEEDLKFELA